MHIHVWLQLEARAQESQQGANKVSEYANYAVLKNPCLPFRTNFVSLNKMQAQSGQVY